MAAINTCPSCHRELPAGAFMCQRCELIVDGAPVEAAPAPPSDPSLVYAMLAPATAKLDKPSGPPAFPRDALEDEVPSGGAFEDRTTAAFQGPDANAIATVVGGIDPKRYSLSTFEAYLISLVDGTSDVGTIGLAAGLRPVEVKSVFHSLVQRGVLAINPPAPKAPPKPVAPPPAAPAVLGKVQTSKMAVFREPATVAVSPESSADNPLQEAIALEKKGDFKGAIRVLESAVAHTAQPAPLYNKLALVVVKERRDFGAAESLLRKAVELDPQREVYSKNLAWIVKLAGQALRVRGPK